MDDCLTKSTPYVTQTFYDLAGLYIKTEEDLERADELLDDMTFYLNSLDSKRIATLSMEDGTSQRYANDISNAIQANLELRFRKNQFWIPKNKLK